MRLRSLSHVGAPHAVTLLHCLHSYIAEEQRKKPTKMECRYHSQAQHRFIPLYCKQSSQTCHESDSSEAGQESDFPPARIWDSPPLTKPASARPYPHPQASSRDSQISSPHPQKSGIGLGQADILNVVDAGNEVSQAQSAKVTFHTCLQALAYLC